MNREIKKLDLELQEWDKECERRRREVEKWNSKIEKWSDWKFPFVVFSLFFIVFYLPVATMPLIFGDIAGCILRSSPIILIVIGLIVFYYMEERAKVERRRLRQGYREGLERRMMIFERKQRAKGLVKFIDRLGRIRWVLLNR